MTSSLEGADPDASGGRATGSTATSEVAQTLDRGLEILNVLSETGPMRVAEIAAQLGLSRPIVYRLTATLEGRGFISRQEDGRFVLGTVLLELARRVAPTIREAARPLLWDLAVNFEATAILVIAEGEEAVCLDSVEPPGLHVRLAYPPGFRHPLHLTASGMAILAGRPPRPGERAEISTSRELGYSVSHQDIQKIPGVGIAVPISVNGRDAQASIAVASLDHDLDPEVAAAALRAAAADIAERLL